MRIPKRCSGTRRARPTDTPPSTASTPAVRWKKQSPEHALEIVDPNGFETPVALNPGTTYIGLVSVDNAGEFAYGTGGQPRRISSTEEKV